MKFSLIGTQGKAQGKSIPITLSQFIIGRDPQCHLRPASPMISKRHCAILIRGEKAFLRDFESTNGSLVNGQPVKGEVELKNDDKIQLGPILFIARIEATAPAPAPAVAKKPATATQTPAPAAASTAKVAKSTDQEDDDAMAALLLDAEGDPVPADQSAAASDSIPTGSTVFELPKIKTSGSETPAPEAGKEEQTAGDAKKPTAKPSSSADTSAAAKALLDKYTRRPRT